MGECLSSNKQDQQPEYGGAGKAIYGHVHHCSVDSSVVLAVSQSAAGCSVICVLWFILWFVVPAPNGNVH